MKLLLENPLFTPKTCLLTHTQVAILSQYAGVGLIEIANFAHTNSKKVI